MTAFTSCNPASGEVVFTRPVSSSEQLTRQLASLRHAQHRWAHLDTATRAARLLRLADILSAHRHALAALVSLEVGKLERECLAEID